MHVRHVEKKAALRQHADTYVQQIVLNGNLVCLLPSSQVPSLHKGKRVQNHF